MTTTRFAAARSAAVPTWFTVLMAPAVIVVGLIAAVVSFGVLIGVGVARLFAGRSPRPSPVPAPDATRTARAKGGAVIDGSWTVLSVRDPEYA